MNKKAISVVSKRCSHDSFKKSDPKANGDLAEKKISNKMTKNTFQN